jgi:1-acyl-sn-glycerol-3-phosphate acyltransferase
MVRNQKNFIIRWILHVYVRWIVNRHFNELLFDKIAIDENKSILVIANHFSYWDSLVLYLIGRKLFLKKFHVMVREDTTLHMRHLKYAGAFSVKKKSRDMLESLDYAAELLNDPQNLVLIFPQGKLYSNFVNRINFEKGVMKVMEKAEGKFQLVFAAMFIQYMKHKKPTATVYLKKQEHIYQTADKMQQAYQLFYDGAKTEQTEIVI